MQAEILTKEYVVEHGVNVEELCYNPAADMEYLEADGEDTGYTGIVYELSKEGVLLNYSFYEEGFPNGDTATFHENGNLKSYATKSGGMLNGESEEWDEDGNRVLYAEYKWGIVMKRDKWASDGLQIEEYEAPASHVKMAQKLEEKYSR